MIFYLFFISFILLFVGLNIKDQKNNHQLISNKLIKILVIVFMCLRIFYDFLPDQLTVTEGFETSSLKRIIILFRTFNDLMFVLLPISFFYKKKSFSFLFYLMIPFYIGTVVLYTKTVPFFQDGFGLGSIAFGYHNNFWEFLTSNGFTYSMYAFYLIFEGFLIVWFAFNKYQDLKNINIKFICKSLGLLGLLVLCFFPLYGPMHYFGYCPFDIDNIYVSIFWLIFIGIEVLVLTKIFKNKSEEDKYCLLMVLALSLIFMYSQMFNIIECIRPRYWPIQLCNIASPIILIMLIKKKKDLYNFILITQCFGAFLAIMTLNIYAQGIFYPWTLHYFVEHQNIIVISLLMLNLKMMPRLTKQSLKDSLKLFSFYYIFVLVFGWVTEALYIKTGNIFWWSNTFFIFKKKQAMEFLPALGIFFDYCIQITPYWSIKLMQLMGYLFFLVCLPLVYLILYACETKRRKQEIKLKKSTE